MKWTILTLFLCSFIAHAQEESDGDSATATATGTSTSTSTATKTDMTLSLKDRMALNSALLSEAPIPAPFEMKTTASLMWEDEDYPERLDWTKYTYRVINPVLDDLNQGKDIVKFCPNYNKISRDQQIIVWAEIFAAIAYWESSYDPLNSTKEIFADKGTDNVTHLPVYSCGLLQLSYQDTITYQDQGFCRFDWEKDRKLDGHDLHRSIFNPYTNLYCGINIMAANVKRNGKIVVHKNYYWSTLQSGNFLEDRHGQMERMIHKNLPFCGGNRFADFILEHTLDPALEFIRNQIDPQDSQ